MIQCFVKKEYAPPFGLARLPRLFSVSRTDAEASVHPRVMHAHGDLVELALICGGESVYFVGGVAYPARRGDLFIYNSGVVHDERSGPEARIASYSLALGGLLVPGLRENALLPDGAPPVYHVSEAETARLERLYAVLFDELKAGNEDGCHHLLMALLSVVQRITAGEHADGGEAENALSRRVKDYIDAHFAEEFSLQMLADSLHVSQYYLSHVFKDVTGYSPLQYVLRRRIGEAQTLLITTGLPVTQIAARVGYDNPSHFNAQFAKAVGMPPRTFRREYVQQQEIESL